MKKGVRIFIVLLAVSLFARVCFANYAINPEVQKYTTEYDEMRKDNDQMENTERQKAWKVVKIAGLVVLIAAALYGIFVLMVILTGWNEVTN